MDVATEAADAFGPLKATLGAISAIYANYEVCLQPFVGSTLLTDSCTGNSRRQGKDRKPQLTHNGAGDDIRSTFGWRSGADTQGRTAAVCHCSFIRLEAEFLSASSRISRDNCGSYPRSQGCSDLLNMFGTAGRFPGSLKVYKTLSPTIRSIHELGVVLDADRGVDGTTDGDPQPRA